MFPNTPWGTGCGNVTPQLWEPLSSKCSPRNPLLYLAFVIAHRYTCSPPYICPVGLIFQSWEPECLCQSIYLSHSEGSWQSGQQPGLRLSTLRSAVIPPAFLIAKPTHLLDFLPPQRLPLRSYPLAKPLICSSFMKSPLKIAGNDLSLPLEIPYYFIPGIDNFIFLWRAR